MTVEILEKNYDSVPYTEYPYPQTRPDSLYTMARLFGMSPPDYKKARVLELGCASGANLIPMAQYFPESKFVGIDLSSTQIQKGQKTIQDTGLKNIELKHQSILDFDPAAQDPFDYVIVHGVFSWVPKEVQEGILKIAKDSLSENGLAYISYNVLPGWNQVKTVRDMMLYHATNFETPQEKVQQGLLLLEFIYNNMNDKNPSKAAIRTEYETLKSQPASYIFHDHFEAYNDPMYFKDFMAMAKENDLQYVGDISLHSMYLGNLGKEAQEKLSTIGDIVRAEQYSDFVVNRRFRSSILCKKGMMINRSLQPEAVENFYVETPMVFENNQKLEEAALTDKSEIEAYVKKQNAVKTSSPALKVALNTMISNMPHTTSMQDILKTVFKTLPDLDQAQTRQDLFAHFLNFGLKGLVSFSSEPVACVTEKTEKPMVFPLIRYQAKEKAHVTNVYHKIIQLSDVQRVLFQSMDGQSDMNEIVEKSANMLKEQGGITYKNDNKHVTDVESLKEFVSDNLDQQIAFAARNGLLAA